MRDTKDFINRVVKKLGLNPNEFTVIEDSNVYEDVNEDIINALGKGIVFIEGSCIPNSVANQVAKEFNSLNECKVFTFDKDSGVSLIVSYADDSEIVEGINIQSLGIINTFLNLFNTYSVEPVNEIEQEPTEHISLKDYYRLNLPDNKIGRKSDETLIKELEESGFKV